MKNIAFSYPVWSTKHRIFNVLSGLLSLTNKNYPFLLLNTRWIYFLELRPGGPKTKWRTDKILWEERMMYLNSVDSNKSISTSSALYVICCCLHLRRHVVFKIPHGLSPYLNLWVARNAIYTIKETNQLQFSITASLPTRNVEGNNGVSFEG